MSDARARLVRSMKTHPPARLYRAARPAAAVTQAPATPAVACVHLGGELRQAPCASCPGAAPALVAVRACKIHGECTADRAGRKTKGVRSCGACGDYLPPGAASRVAHFSEHNLARGQAGRRFNCSILDDPSTPRGFLFAYRDGWHGSEIWLCRLGPDLNVTQQPWKLNLYHRIWSVYGREDPRLFVHDGRVHVAYIGVQGREKITHTNMMYARLSADCSRAEEVFYVHYRWRNDWEKNWSMFSHGGQLYAVYSAAPHRILRIDGDVATLAYETETHAPWRPGTEMRGGAAPALVGEEYWHFFHSRYDSSSSGTGKSRYMMGLYAFRAAPPFDVLRICPEPLMLADPATNRGTGDDNRSDVIFPCGAARRGDDWFVSAGVHDRWGEIHRFDHAELESRLVPVRPPAWWSYPAEGPESGMLTAGEPVQVSRRKMADDIFLSVSLGNEYGLPDRMDGWACLDVGAHCGSFAHAARLRGATLLHCYEPAAEYFPALAANARRMGCVRAFKTAVGSYAGTDVPVATLAEAVSLLAADSPSGLVDLLKIDCEGGEWDAFAEPDAPWHLVDAIVGEYHLFPGRGLSLDALFAPLRSAGFTVEYKPPASPDAFWGLFTAARRAVP